MANQNTSEYVDNIRFVRQTDGITDAASPRSRLLENLRMLPHAPVVQMADIPEDSVNLEKKDEEVTCPTPPSRGAYLFWKRSILSPRLNGSKTILAARGQHQKSILAHKLPILARKLPI